MWDGATEGVLAWMGLFSRSTTRGWLATYRATAVVLILGSIHSAVGMAFVVGAIDHLDTSEEGVGVTSLVMGGVSITVLGGYGVYCLSTSQVSQKMIASLLDEPEYRTSLGRCLCIGNGLNLLLCAIITADMIATVGTGSTLQVVCLAVLIVCNYITMFYAASTVSVSISVCLCARRTLAYRSEWMRQDFINSLDRGSLHEGSALRLIRAYSSLAILVELVSKVCSPAVAAATVAAMTSGVWNFSFAVRSIQQNDGSWGEDTPLFVAYVGCAVAGAALSLYVPAKVSAVVSQTSKQLKYICSGAVNVSSNYNVSSLSVTSRASRTSALSYSSGSSSGSSSSVSNISSGSGGSVKGRARKSRIKQLGAQRQPSSAAADTVCYPTLPVPPLATGGPDSLMRLSESAVVAEVGVEAADELQFLSYIAVHLRESVPAVEVGGISITYSFIGRAVTSALSAVFVLLRVVA